MRLIQLTDIAQLRAHAVAWDRLWQASDVAAPTARAELVALWIETFEPGSKFRCLVVEQEGSFAAALPLVQTRVKRLLPVGGVVANCWCAAGQLLVDPAAPEDALTMLAEGLCTLPWPLLWLEGIDPTTAAWQRFLAACGRAQVAHHFRHDRVVGLIDIDHDWQAYEASRSKNLTKTLRRTRRRLEDFGRVEFSTQRVRDPDQAEMLLHRATQIEERSWKANRGTHVSRSPRLLQYFTRQARQLAQWDALDVSFLEVAGQPVAFEYGYRGKGVHLGHKTGYDETLAAACPGQHLMREILKSLHADPDIRLFDCLGPLSEAISRWATRTYPEGRLMLAPPKLMGRALWSLYRFGEASRRRLELQPAGQ